MDHCAAPPRSRCQRRDTALGRQNAAFALVERLLNVPGSQQVWVHFPVFTRLLLIAHMVLEYAGLKHAAGGYMPVTICHQTSTVSIATQCLSAV